MRALSFILELTEMSKEEKWQKVSLSESAIQTVAEALREHALKLEEEGADSKTVQKISDLAYIFQELGKDPSLRDKPLKP